MLGFPANLLGICWDSQQTDHALIRLETDLFIQQTPGSESGFGFVVLFRHVAIQIPLHEDPIPLVDPKINRIQCWIQFIQAVGFFKFTSEEWSGLHYKIGLQLSIVVVWIMTLYLSVRAD